MAPRVTMRGGGPSCGDPPETMAIKATLMTAEPFPLYYPSDARRPFETDDATRRFANVAGLGSGAKVLDLACGRGNAALVLAREYGCEVVAADAEEAFVQQLAERVKAFSLTGRVDARKVGYAKLPFAAAEFDAILIQGPVILRSKEVAEVVRNLLAPNGRLGFTYPAKVGRSPAKTALEFWEGRLGEALLLPRELLLQFQQSGYEPETVETLADAELAELYRQAEAKLDSDPRAATFRQEIEIFRAGARASVTYAMVIGRRREPGEKPPASRDRG